MVIVERHGVRPPTKAAADLAKFSQSPWPEWSVAPGELTTHGAKAIAQMGAALKRYYLKERLLGSADCADVFVWSDSGDQRTRASGDALLSGMGCATPSQHRAAGQNDPLFDPIAAGICPVDPANARAAVESRLSLVLNANRAAYDKGRKTLQSVLTPDGCGKADQPACSVGEGADEVVTKNGETRLTGPLATASSLSENLLLEYAEGLPLTDVGWGRGAAALDDVMPLHNLYADVMRRTSYFAARRGSPLMQQIIDLLESRPSRFRGAAPVPANAKLVVFLGHDTNLSNLSGLLDVAWSLPGQPDLTAPDTAVAFELWRADDDTRTVRVRTFYQTLAELRAASPIAFPRQVPLALSGCVEGLCRVDALTASLQRAIASECIKPE